MAQMFPSLPDDLDVPRDRPFTTAEARAAGVTYRTLARWTAYGSLRHPVRGVFVSSRLPDSLELRARCLALVMPADCFATDHTAAWLHCGDDVLPPNAHLAVPRVSFFRPSEQGRLRNGLCRSGERDVHPDELDEVAGLPCTTPLRTAWDLGRLQQRDVALAGMDQLMRRGGFGLEELCAGVERFRGRRGVVQLRLLAPRVDPGAESFGESALRNRWYDAGLPRPRTQIPVERPDGAPYRLDLGDEEVRYAAEYDGEDAHDGTGEVDEGRRAWISRSTGFVIAVFRREQVFGRAQDADLVLRDGYARARAARW